MLIISAAPLRETERSFIWGGGEIIWPRDTGVTAYCWKEVKINVGDKKIENWECPEILGVRGTKIRD